MQKPSWLATNFNVPTLLALAGIFYTVVSYSNALDNRINQNDGRDKDLRQKVEDGLSELKQAVGQVNAMNIPYRVTVNEQQLVATNKRVDDISAQVVSGFEALRRDINTVGTKVEVLTSKIDALTPPTRKTSMPQRDALVRSVPLRP